MLERLRNKAFAGSPENKNDAVAVRARLETLLTGIPVPSREPNRGEFVAAATILGFTGQKHQCYVE